MDKEAIKAWLKAIRRNRLWLAENTGCTLATVNKWLSTSRPVPQTAVRLIARLIEQYPNASGGGAASPASSPSENAITLTVSEAQFDKWNAAATAENKLLRQWCVDVIEKHFQTPPGVV